MKKKTEIRAKDSIVKTGANSIKLPKLKGKFSIELFDAETGRLDRKVESENLVTNAIRDIFAANNLGLTDYSSIMPLSTKLFGGILCFANALTENADNYYLPKSSVNPIIAHAGQTTYAQASADTTRGQPNDVESGVITNGYKHVWEFASTQGNGTISALGLCPADLGDWAMNGGTNFFPFTRLDMCYRAQGYVGWGHRCPSIFDATNRRAFIFNNTSSNAVIREVKDYGVIQDIGVNQCSVATKTDPLEYEDHSFPISNADKCYILYYQGNIHYLYASGTTITRTIINTSSWTTSSDSLTVTGAALATPSAFATGNFTDIDSDGYVYFLGSNSKFYKVNYTNLADVIAIDRQNSDGAIAHLGGFSCFGQYCHVTTKQYDYAYIIEGSNAHRCASSKTGSPMQQVNPSNYIAENLYNGPATGMMRFNNDLVRTIGACSNNTNLFENAGYSNAMSKLFLSTIKNLDTPVTKTSTQTMKITYSITEVQEGE